LINNNHKILIIKFRHIGDVLLTAPLISTLKQSSPTNRIYTVVKQGTEAMLEGHPDLEQLYILPSRDKGESKLTFLKRYTQWLWRLRKERFSIAINTTSGDRGIILSFLIGAKTRIGILKKNDEKWWRRWMITHPAKSINGRHHTVIGNLSLADYVLSTPNNTCYEVKLTFTPNDLTTVKEVLSADSSNYQTSRGLIHIHPTSRWLFKCWRDDAVAEVIDWLQKNDYCVVLTAAPIDEELARIDSILKQCHTKPINLAGKLTLKQLAALSSISNLFFGVDSAPMHIAASQNTPVIGIFGPSGTFDWGPWPNGWSPESITSIKTPYPEQNGTQHAAPHTVIQQKWECAPCGQDGCDGSKQSRCLDELSTETVISILKQHLSEI